MVRVDDYLSGHSKYLVGLDQFCNVRLKTENIELSSLPCEQCPKSIRLFLARFLIATKGDEDHAIQGLRAHLNWYQEMQVTKLVDLSHKEALGCAKLHKHRDQSTQCDDTRYVYGKDKKGHHVVYSRASVKQVKKIIKNHSVEDCINYHIWLNENLFQRIDKEGVNSQITCVIDLKGLYATSLSSEVLSFYRKQVHVDQNHYPERIYKIILINAPFVFSFIW
eukprot:CAMPEP_0184017330 /NCGR_PEP_ID=MMETSP0954-20121128/7469_1 /TAXON_ID=627963 /ORGANISM="Aplanochytrium sp, Strain PBS07" /LENGTH=221 /DNA_ID=CAMNT_0026298539 /DNA_START=327 /DNA_END=989 /DNA_ORIENTATION=-